MKWRLEIQYTYAENQAVNLNEALQDMRLNRLVRAQLSDTAQEQLQWLQGEQQAVQLNENEQDGISWKWGSAEFSVKTAYFAMMDEPRIANTYNRIWSINGPPRFKVFGWLISRNRILTLDNLTRRGWQLANRCALCKEDSETVAHMLNECSFTPALYQRVKAVFNTRQPSVKALISTRYSDKERSIFLIAQFIIWRERCARIFRESAATVEELMEQVMVQYQYSQIRSNS